MANKAGVLFFVLCAGLGVSSLAGCGSGSGSSGGSGGGVTQPDNPVPVLASVGPTVVLAGSPAMLITAAGSDFVTGSVVMWNKTQLNTMYNSSESLTAEIPSADLAGAGTAALTVFNLGPGGGTSNGVNFTVKAASTAVVTTVPIFANSLAWDPVNQVIYLSLPSIDGTNGNSVQVLDPATGALGVSAVAGSEPDLLSVSANSEYLYVGLDGASAVQRMTLPNLGMDIQIPSTSDPTYGSFFAYDLQAAPNSDATVAVLQGASGIQSPGIGGVVIFDNATARPDVLCGWTGNGCTGGTSGYLYSSIQWNSDGSEMYAANTEDTGFDFLTIPVTSSGFGTVTDYPSLVEWFGAIHYDKTTQYVYDDNGLVINPSNGQVVGKFFDVISSSGVDNGYGHIVPDGSLGVAFSLVIDRSDSSGKTYFLESYDIKKFNQIATLSIPNVVGAPTHLIRWGAEGLAFTTGPITYPASPPATGAVYIVNGSFFQQ